MPIVDFLFVIVELFSLCVTAEALNVNIDWKLVVSTEVGQLSPKFQVKGDVPHQPFFILIKLDALTFYMVQECGQKFLSFCHNLSV